MLSSFFYGYILTQFIAGYLCAVLPGSYVFACSVGTVSLLTLLTPLAANAGVGYLVGLRSVIGLLEGGLFPAFFAILTRWAPKHERTRMIAISFSGMQVGTIAAMSSCAVLADRFGWESIFYGTGSYLISLKLTKNLA